jgi:hypothetical protein
MDIRFGDHASFHRAAAGMVGGAATLGLALHAITPLAPLVGGLFGLSIGTAWGYGKTRWRLAAATAASVPLIAMGSKLIAGTTAANAPMAAPILAAVAAVMGLGLAAFGPRGIRGLVAVMLGSFTTLLAMWAAMKITGGVGGHGARELAHVPAWTRDLMASAAMGMIGVFTALPRHLKVSMDPVKAAIRQLPTELDTEVRDLCNRSIDIWNGAKDKLEDNDPGKNLVRDGVLKTLEVATKSADVKMGGSEEELAKRMEDLDKRIASATDSEVKTQYQAARAALDDQRRYRDHIKQNRERLIARMHNHVAALEKFQLAAGGLAAVRAASAGAAAVKQLEELSADVAASGEALAELEIGAAPEAAEPVTVTEPTKAEA